MSVTPAAGSWLLRLGNCTTDANEHRAFFTETWYATPAAVINAELTANMLAVCDLMAQPFGNVPGLKVVSWSPVIERIWPSHKVFADVARSPSGSATPLNTAAPEAAFRLRRVGASGMGRFCFPILTDDWYTDLPHRRQVNLAVLNPLLTAAADPARFDRHFLSGPHVYNVIWHRKTSTFDYVTSYQLLPNPVRIWQRWREYAWTLRVAGDRRWQPPESGRLRLNS